MPESQVSALKQDVHRRQAHLPLTPPSPAPALYPRTLCHPVNGAYAAKNAARESTAY